MVAQLGVNTPGGPDQQHRAVTCNTSAAAGDYTEKGLKRGGCNMAESQQQVCVRQRGTGGKDEQAEMKTAMAQRSDDDVCSFRVLFYSAPRHSSL